MKVAPQSKCTLNLFRFTVYNEGFEFIWGFKLYWIWRGHYPALCFLISPGSWSKTSKFKGTDVEPFPNIFSFVLRLTSLPPSLSFSHSLSLTHPDPVLHQPWNQPRNTHTCLNQLPYRWLFSAIIRRVMHPDPDDIFRVFVFASSCAILNLVSSTFGEPLCCGCFYWFVNSLDWAEKPNRIAEGTWL